MTPPRTRPRPISPVRRPVLLGLFAGTAVGVGYLLAGVPNVELMTLVAALAGAALGWGGGAAAGGLAAAVFSLGSPYGPPMPPLLVAQILGFAFAGVIGHLAGRLSEQPAADGRRVRAALIAGAAGFTATLVYDLLTNLGIAVATGMGLGLVFIGAAPFFLIHAGTNTALFAILFPLLRPRLSGLGRPPLTGRPGGTALVAVLLLAAAGTARASTDPVASAAADSADAMVDLPAPDTEVYRALGWRRPVWTPFAPTGLAWADWYTGWLPVTDGGLGSPAVLLAEGGTDRAPLVVRDGVPLATGHVLADDPWLMPAEGLRLSASSFGRDGWGGTGGRVDADTADPRPDRAISRYRGVKGPHETYYRGVHVLSPEASWRAGFEFEESLDVEGYNATDLPDDVWRAEQGVEFPGHARIRMNRTRLIRTLGEADRLQVEYSTARKTRDHVAALRAERLESWDDAVAATMEAGAGRWRTRTVLFWRNRDVAYGDRDSVGDSSREHRLIETGREGFTFDLRRAPAAPGDSPLDGLRLAGARWRVGDRGPAGPGLEDVPADRSGEGRQALAVLTTGVRWGPGRLVADLGAQWDDRAGFGPESGLKLEEDAARPRWRLAADLGGRHARSDEYLTPLLYDVAGEGRILLPNSDLEREKTLRVSALVSWRLVGFDLAVDGAWRRLTRGIAWEAADASTPVTGTWTNGLELDASRVTGRIARQGRFLGWGRLLLEGTWRDFSEKRGRANLLPPEFDLRFHLMWENHFFQEDGIIQIALLSHRLGTMADPWDVTRTATLPARNRHDLVAGLRLVGVHLTLAVRNLLDDRVRLTAGSRSPGREMDMRIDWAFHY